MPTFEHRDWSNPVIDRSMAQQKAVVGVIAYNMGTTHHTYFIPMKFGTKSPPYSVELRDHYPKYDSGNLNIMFSFWTTPQGWEVIRKNAGTWRKTHFMEFGPAWREYQKLKDGIKLWQKIPGPTHVVVEWVGPRTA